MLVLPNPLFKYIFFKLKGIKWTWWGKLDEIMQFVVDEGGGGEAGVKEGYSHCMEV